MEHVCRPVVVAALLLLAGRARGQESGAGPATTPGSEVIPIAPVEGPAGSSTGAAPVEGPAGLEPALRLRLLAPLAQPRNSFFYSGFGIPALRPARATAGEGALVARVRSSLTSSADTRDVDGHRSRMDALFIEHLRLDLEVTVHDRVSLWMELRIGGWDERRDVFRIRNENGDLVIEGEEDKATLGRSTSRHENLTHVAGGLLVNVLRADDGLSGLTISATMKLPTSRQTDISTSGTADLAFTLHGSLALGSRVALHAQFGVVLPTGAPTIFEDFEEFDAHTFVQGAWGVTCAITDWLALAASVEGETAPWDEEVEFLRRPAWTGGLGARFRIGRFTLEAGGGGGLTSGSADWVAWVEFGWASEQLWGGPG